MISYVYSKKGEKILVNNEAVWKQAMEEIIPGIPAFLAFVIVLALEIVLVNKKNNRQWDREKDSKSEGSRAICRGKNNG